MSQHKTFSKKMYFNDEKHRSVHIVMILSMFNQIYKKLVDLQFASSWRVCDFMLEKDT